MTIDFKNQEGVEFLEQVPANSVDLVLVDPPYVTSKDSGMDRWVDHVAKQDTSGSVNLKTESDWQNYKTPEEWDKWLGADLSVTKRAQKMKSLKADYLKYGSIYGKKYAVTTNFGKWDTEFTLEKMQLFIEQFYRVLRPGGTCIIFFDIWKITHLKEMLDRCKFKQHRFIQWEKTNPAPINSKRNYLSNCREVALTAVKRGKPTFNSSHDKGVYRHPIQGGKHRIHKTQKSLPLFEELIEKHSNKGDVILDCFAGSATTAVAAINKGRQFMGCEMDKGFYEQATKRIEEVLSNG